MAQLPPGFVLDGPGQGGPVFGAPPKPPAPPTPLQIRDQQLQEEAAVRAREDQARQAEKDRRDALEWAATHNPDGSPKPTANKGEDGRKATIQNANLDALVNQINEVQRLFNSGQRDNAIPILGSLWEYLPTPANREFDAASAGLAEQGLAAFRVPGTGSQSDYEAKQFSDANRPSSWSTDAENLQRLKQLRQRVDSTRAALGLPPASWIGLDDPQEPAAAATAPVQGQTPPGGGNTPPASPIQHDFGDPGPQMEAATGDKRLIPDPETQARFDAMMRSGASFSEINQYLIGQGKIPISPRDYAAARKYMRENPGAGSLFNVNKYEPVTAVERVITGAGDNAVGAYLANAGQFLSGNTLDNVAGMLGGDAEGARTAFDVVSAQNPNAAALGQISGGIMAGLSGEAGLARLGMGSGIARGLMADTAMGAANGAGMADDGSRLSGAGQGGLSALVGSAMGTGAMKVAGRAVSPSGGRLADLYEAGVRPTPGQRFGNVNDGKGLSGMAGRFVNATEEALQSVPVVGSAIRGAREEARDQFQVGAFNQALAEIGETLPKGMGPGTDPHKFAQTAFNRVYEQARSGMRMVADEELSNDLGRLAPDIQTLGPQAQNKLKAILANSVNSKIVNGELSGNAYKGAVSDLGKHIARLRKGMTADDQTAADILEGVRGSLDAAARRHSDPAAVELLDAADAGYAKLVRIEEAAARRGGDAGTFSPVGFDSSVQKSSGGVRSKAYLRGDAQMQDYAKQGRSLEDRMPNSGTPERMAFGTAAAGGAAYLEPTTLGILGAIGAAYAPGVRKVVKGAMAPGGPRSKAIAAQLKKRARLAGAVGAATSVAALPGTAPVQ